jgi:ketosteroid isomerase-like protein
MPDENVEIARRFIEHVNEDDVPGALELVAPQAELDWSESQAPDSGRYHGPDGWGAWLSGRAEDFDDVGFDVTELLDVPPDRVLLVAYMSARGRASGLEIRAQGAALLTVRDGLLTGLRMYQTPAEAREAAGLPSGG